MSRQIVAVTLADKVGTTGVAGWGNLQEGILPVGKKSFEVFISGTGIVTASVQIQVSNSNISSSWVTLATFDLSGTNYAVDAWLTEVTYKYVRVYIGGISGTSAAVTVTMAYEA